MKNNEDYMEGVHAGKNHTDLSIFQVTNKDFMFGYRVGLVLKQTLATQAVEAFDDAFPEVLKDVSTAD